MSGLRVVEPGLWTTVQDLGRPGRREFGVPVGGVFDRDSAALANALAGNLDTCAVLELTLRGGVYLAEVTLGVALAGGSIEASVVASAGARRVLRPPCSTTLAAGDRLELGPLRTGARSYLAVCGGWLTRPVLASRSAERTLQPGETIPAEPSRLPGRRPATLWNEGSERANAPIRVLDGPDAASAGRGWIEREFRVDATSGRMGVRLEPDLPVVVDASDDRVSMPVAPGAVQVAGGRLIVLGPACGTMGGYPHVAHVVSADLGRVGQLRPGQAVRFALVTLDEARRLDHESRARLRRVGLVTATLARDGF